MDWLIDRLEELPDLISTYITIQSSGYCKEEADQQFSLFFMTEEYSVHVRREKDGKVVATFENWHEKVLDPGKTFDDVINEELPKVYFKDFKYFYDYFIKLAYPEEGAYGTKTAV